MPRGTRLICVFCLIFFVFQNLPEMSTNQIEQQLQEASAKMGQFYALELKLEESSEVSFNV